MVRLENYNVVKEGNLYNIYGYSTNQTQEILASSELNGLYDGDFTSVATSISGATASGSVIVLEANWGETLDVYQIRYYHDDTVASGVSLSYGIDSNDLSELALTTASGESVSEVVGDARFIRVIHSLSPEEVVNIHQLVVEGVKNDKLGFGASESEEEEYFRPPNGPLAYASSSPFTIPVYNDYDAPVDVRVCQAPTGSDADDYVFIGMSEEGPYYGINEFGFSVPANEPLVLVNDSLVYDELGDISSQWEVLRGVGQGRFSTTAAGINIKVSGVNPGIPVCPLSARFYGLMSSQTFTGNQSFTIRVKVKLLASFSDWGGGFDFSFGFSNTTPLPAVSRNQQWPYTDEGYPTRPGRSGMSLSLLGPGHLSRNPYQVLFTDGLGKEGTGLYYDWQVAGYKTSAELTSILVGGASDNTDWSSLAEFRDVIVTWDHINRVAHGYIDSVEIGSAQFSNPPLEGSKIFVGVDASSWAGGEIVFKDFQVSTTELFTQRNISLLERATATAYESLDPIYHGSAKMVDNTDLEWISGYDVKPNDWVEFALAESPNIVGFFITNPGGGEPGWGSSPWQPLVHNVSGTTSKFLSYSADILGIRVDSGDFTLYNVDYVRGNTTTRRFVDDSGSPTTFSGAAAVKVYLASLVGEHDPTTDFLSAAGVREFGILQEYGEPITVFPAVSISGTVPWNRCNTFNLKQYGISGAMGVAKDVCEIARVRDPAQLVRGIDYDVSNAFFYRWGGQSTAAENAREYNVFLSRDGNAWNMGNFEAVIWNFTVPVAVWRRFSGRSKVKALHLCWGSGLNVAASLGLIDKFKVQYLEQGGDVGSEDSWKDFPTITQPYTGASAEYTSYRQYFIDNNDGEYYADVAYSYPNCPGMPSGIWYMPDDVVAKKDFRWAGTWWVNGSCGIHLESSLYLEFDEAVETEAVRVVILECLSEDRLSNVSVMNIVSMSVFVEKTHGFLQSPIFDTGSSLNTERLFTDIKNRATTSGTVLVRSFDQAPLYKSDYRYLNWLPWVAPLLDTEYDFSSAGITAAAHFSQWPKFGIVLGSKVYILPTDSDFSPIIYDYDTDSWTLGDPLAAAVENVRVASTITNHCVQLDNGDLYVATLHGSLGSKKIARFGITADEYGISGWRYLSVNWPEEAEYGAMAGHSSNLYFFCSTGETIVMDPETGVWDPMLARIPLHGFSNRTSPWPVVKNNSVYLFGGYEYGTNVANRYVDVYDISSNSWRTVDEIPVHVGRHVYAVLYGDDVIILPARYNENSTPAVFSTSAEYTTYAPVSSLSSERMFYDAYDHDPVQLALALTFATPWVYGDYLYSGITDSSNPSFRKTKVFHDSWEHGFLPSKYDPIWGYGSDIMQAAPWTDVSSCGEVLAQDRYFQFSVRLEAGDDAGVTPEFRKASVITPQTMYQVSASGTDDFYVKLGVSANVNYEGWYCGLKDIGYTDAGWSSFYVSSSDGVSIGYSEDVLVPTLSSGCYSSFASPFVIKNSTNEYSMWVTRGYCVSRDSPYETVASGAVYYSVSADGSTWDAPYEVVPLGACGGYDSAAAGHCCVVRKSFSEYLMWYTGTSLSDGYRRVLSGTSSDGLTWSGFSLAVDIKTLSMPGYPDETASYAPSVLYSLETGLYTMWYSGLSAVGKASIIRCSSSDGVLWNSFKVVIPSGYYGYFDIKAAHYPCVILDASTYKMWYVGTDSDGINRILYCYSSDGVIWSSSVFIMAEGFSDLDAAGIGRLAMISNRDVVVPNTFFSGAKIKIYNG